MSLEEYSLADLVDWQNPINPNDSLNQGLMAKYLAGGPYYGTGKWWNLPDNTWATDGTLTNMTTPYGWTGAMGRPGGWGAMRFDGVDDYVNLGNGSGFNLNAITVSAWVYFGVITGARNVVSKVILTSPYGWALRINGTNNLDFFISTATGFYLCESTPTLNEWKFLTGTYDGETSRLYINGVQVNSNTAPSGNLYTTSANVNIGRDAAFGGYLNGYADDINIYNRALSSTEVAGLYEASMSYYPTQLNRFAYRPKYVPSGFNPALAQDINRYLGMGVTCVS